MTGLKGMSCEEQLKAFGFSSLAEGHSHCCLQLSEEGRWRQRWDLFCLVSSGMRCGNA